MAHNQLNPSKMAKPDDSDGRPADLSGVTSPAGPGEPSQDQPTPWAELGLTPPNFSAYDQSQAPPVDREVLRRLVCGELADHELQAVAENLSRYRSWWQGVRDAAADSLRASRGSWD